MDLHRTPRLKARLQEHCHFPPFRRVHVHRNTETRRQELSAYSRVICSVLLRHIKSLDNKIFRAAALLRGVHPHQRHWTNITNRRHSLPQLVLFYRAIAAYLPKQVHDRPLNATRVPLPILTSPTYNYKWSKLSLADRARDLSRE